MHNITDVAARLFVIDYRPSDLNSIPRVSCVAGYFSGFLQRNTIRSWFLERAVWDPLVVSHLSSQSEDLARKKGGDQRSRHLRTDIYNTDVVSRRDSGLWVEVLYSSGFAVPVIPLDSQFFG